MHVIHGSSHANLAADNKNKGGIYQDVYPNREH
jgi:hypothetical protein